MYEHHFGLRTKPFGLSPDPRFLYQKASHREALASLIYGIHERRGFIALVGEVGTGKTTLVNALLDLFNYNMRTILISHSTLNREELLSMVLHQLDVQQPMHRNRIRGDNDFWAEDGLSHLTRVEMLHRFYRFIRSEKAAHRPPPLLLIDEAQNLSLDVLEEIRLLTNLETAQEKLLQVVLVGQPELEHKLSSQRLRALRQRIAVYSKLEPLTLEETMEYVIHRMQTVGGNARDIFNSDALKAIYRASSGIPRVINLICEQCLVNTFGAGEERIDEFLTAEAIRDTCFAAEAGFPFLNLGSRGRHKPGAVSLGHGVSWSHSEGHTQPTISTDITRRRRPV